MTGKMIVMPGYSYRNAWIFISHTVTLLFCLFVIVPTSVRSY